MNKSYNDKLHEKTLCGDCVWIDFDNPDKYNRGYYFCKKQRKYVKIDINTCCSSWVNH